MCAVFLSSTKLWVRLQTQISAAPLMLRRGAHTKESFFFFPLNTSKRVWNKRVERKKEKKEKKEEKKLFGNISGRTDQNIQMNSD